MLKADLTIATVEGGRGGGGVSLRAGASVWSNIPYINEMIPTSWVALSVEINCVGSSSFLSNTSPQLQTHTNNTEQTQQTALHTSVYLGITANNKSSAFDSTFPT